MPIKKKIKLNHKESSILYEMRLFREHAFTVNELTEELDMSWETARKTLDDLFQKGFVKMVSKKFGSSIRWKLITKKRKKRKK